MRFFRFLIFLTGLSFVFPFFLKAQSITYSEHIAPIVYTHCSPCHRTGEVAPFPLTNYTEVASMGSFIKYVTGIRYMPPWKPEVGLREYLNENFLTQTQIQRIADWVDQGMPEGNPALAPPFPNFPTGSQVGVPDLVLSFSQSFTQQGNNQDHYRYFVLPTGLTQDRDLIALEVRPGNSKIVHHTLVWQDNTGQAAQQDAATPEYGFEGGGLSESSLNNQLPGYVPGQKPHVYTHGMGQKLLAGSDLLLQMHYAPTPVPEKDSSTVNLFFAPQSITREVKSYVMLPTQQILTNGPFIIYPNTVKEFHGRFTIPFPVTLLGLAPHMHKLGKHWKIYAVKPNNDTIRLMNINDWDFNWQGTFYFKKPVVLPTGSVIHAFAKYDNTTNNIYNPNNPPQTVSWGELTKDEMYYLPLIYLNSLPGDDTLTFGDGGSLSAWSEHTLPTDKLYPIYPNPANEWIKIGFTAGMDGGDFRLKVYDASGRLIQDVFPGGYCMPGFHTFDVDIRSWAPGVYFIHWEGKQGRQVQSLIVNTRP
jgi:hypothetical protein